MILSLLVAGCWAAGILLVRRYAIGPLDPRHRQSDPRWQHDSESLNLAAIESKPRTPANVREFPR